MRRKPAVEQNRILPADETPTTPTPTQSELETRPAVGQMSGFKSLDEVAESAPETTMATRDENESGVKTRKPRKPRTPKTPEPTTPDNMATDRRYADAVARMSGFGGGTVIKTAFNVTGKPLDAEETTEVEDLFYVVSKQYSLDPSKSPILMSIYAILLLLRLCAVRMMGSTSTNIWDNFAGIFGKEAKAEADAD